MSDRLTDALRRVDELSGGTPPTELIAHARDQSASLGASRRLRNRRLAAVTTAALAVTIAAAFTPPGRAATGWLADLAGFGEEPSLEQKGSVPDSAVVLTSGELSDGTRYEVVAKRVLFGVGPDTRQENDNRPALLCFQVDFPGTTEKGQGGHCTDGEENGVGLGNESAGLFQEPTADGSSIVDQDGPGLYLGLVEISEAASVRVFVTRDGEAEPIASELIEVKGDLLARTGTDTPVGVFVAPIDAELVQAGRSDELEVRALAYSPEGEEIGHSDLFFPPRCPPAPEPLSPPPAGTPPPRPVSPAEREAIQADPCAELARVPAPPSVSSHRLSREPVPPSLSNAARAAGHPIEAAPAAAYDPLFEPGYEASTVDHAAFAVTDEAVPEVTEGEPVGGVIGEAHIYLALTADEGRLAYVVSYEARGFTGDDAPPDPARAGLPRRFLGIVDVESGERLLYTEL